MTQIKITITIDVPDGSAVPEVLVQQEPVETPILSGIQIDEKILAEVSQELVEDEATERQARVDEEKKAKVKEQPKYQRWDEEIEDFVLDSIAKQRPLNKPHKKDTLPEKLCPMCGLSFAPHTMRQKFHAAPCKDKYGRRLKIAKRDDALEAFYKEHPINPETGETYPVVKKVEKPTVQRLRKPQRQEPDSMASSLNNEFIVPGYRVSDDPFYREQLIKKAREDPAYRKYLKT